MEVGGGAQPFNYSNSSGGSVLKEFACQCRSGLDPRVGQILLEKEMATHSNIPAWEILWTEKPGRLQSRATCTNSLTCLNNFNHCDYYPVSQGSQGV